MNNRPFFPSSSSARRRLSAMFFGLTNALLLVFASVNPALADFVGTSNGNIFLDPSIGYNTDLNDGLNVGDEVTYILQQQADNTPQ